MTIYCLRTIDDLYVVIYFVSGTNVGFPLFVRCPKMHRSISSQSPHPVLHTTERLVGPFQTDYSGVTMFSDLLPSFPLSSTNLLLTKPDSLSVSFPGLQSHTNRKSSLFFRGTDFSSSSYRLLLQPTPTYFIFPGSPYPET